MQISSKVRSANVCLLCSKAEGSYCSDVIGKSKHTFAEVLAKLVKRAKLSMKMTEQELRGEVLCLKCREMVEDVFQLHYQLQEKKDKIVNMVKKTLELRKDDIDSDLDEMDVKKERKVSRKESLSDEVYNIELLKEKKGDKFLVKWENFSEDYNSWEPRKSIPEDIVKVQSHC